MVSVRFMLLNSWLLNGGDAAIALAEKAQLEKRFGDDTFVVVSTPQERAARCLYRDLNVVPQLFSAGRPLRRGFVNRLVRTTRKGRIEAALQLRNPARMVLLKEEKQQLERMESANALIAAGGTYLTDYYSLEGILFDYRAARMLKRPLCFFPQSIGPLTENKRMRALAEAFSHATLICVRDERSLNVVQRIQPEAESKAVVLADSAFYFSRHHAKGVLRRDNDSSSRSEGRPRVAVSARPLLFPESSTTNRGVLRTRYLEELARTVEELVKAGFDVLFISTTQGFPEHEDDGVFAARVVEKVAKPLRERLTVDGKPHRPEELIERYSQCAVALSVRMHGAILAMCAGIPTVAIAYEFKTRELMERLGLKERVFDAETFVADEVARAVCTAAEEEVLTQETLEGIDRMAESCEQAPRLLAERLG